MENQKLEASVLSAIADFRIEMEKLFGKQIAFSIQIKGIPLSKIANISENNEDIDLSSSRDIFGEPYSYVILDSIEDADVELSSCGFKSEIPYSVAFIAEPGESIHNDGY